MIGICLVDVVGHMLSYSNVRRGLSGDRVVLYVWVSNRAITKIPKGATPANFAGLANFDDGSKPLSYGHTKDGYKMAGPRAGDFHHCMFLRSCPEFTRSCPEDLLSLDVV